jgi:hypothetical protein
MDQASDVLTPAEVAAFLRTDPDSVRQLLDAGTLAGFKSPASGEFCELLSSISSAAKWRRPSRRLSREVYSISASGPVRYGVILGCWLT